MYNYYNCFEFYCMGKIIEFRTYYVSQMFYDVDIV